MSLSPTHKTESQRILAQHLSNYIPLEESDLNLLVELVPIRRYSKGEFLLRAGQTSKEFFFNISGFVRLYYLQQGEERTAYFYGERLFISAYESYVKQKPSNFYLQATEETTVAVIGVEAAQKLLSTAPKFEALARIAMEEELISLQDIIATLLTLSPEQRYLQLLERNPKIFQRVPQVYIASYIGVKPESLSRIKKRAHLKS